jgi:hypothetical protein
MFRSWINKTIKRGDLGRTIPDFVNASGATPMELDMRSAAVVPEPATGVLCLGAFSLVRRRRRRSAAAGAA